MGDQTRWTWSSICYGRRSSLSCSPLLPHGPVATETCRVIKHCFGNKPQFFQTVEACIGTSNNISKQLVPEFSHFHFSEQQCNIDGYRLLASPLPGDTTTDLPKESKKMRKAFKYGVQWDPQDFLEKAKEVQHPKNPHHSLPDVLKEAMFQVLSSDPIELAKHRLQVVLAVKRRSGEVVNEEKKLKSEMD